MSLNPYFLSSFHINILFPSESLELVPYNLFGELISIDELVLLEDELEVLFPFGYGLSYSKFKYSNLEINMKGVSFTITNAGDYDAYEVPQLYISYYNKENIYPLTDASLKGFKKVFLRKNEAK